MDIKTYRKIIVGDNFLNCIRYVKGSSYTMGDKRNKICTIVDSGSNSKEIDIYAEDKGTKFLWKSINKKTLLEKEYDANFQ